MKGPRASRVGRVRWQPAISNCVNIPKVEIGTIKVAVVFHLYFIEDLDYYLTQLKNISVSFDLLVTVGSSDSEKILYEKLPSYGLNVNRSEVYVAKNMGRNFAPFLVHFGGNLAANYDFFLHIHTKRSSHSQHLENWSTFLVQNLIGSPEIVDNVLAFLVYSPKFGVVHPITYPHLGHLADPWDGNERLGNEILIKLGFTEFHDFFIFPAGGMFWARVDSLRELLNHGWRYEDFVDEDKKELDSFRTPYAIERLVGLIPLIKGFQNAYIHQGNITLDDSFTRKSGFFDHFRERCLLQNLED